MSEIFSRLPRIADAVFNQPWMILPEFHLRTLVPQLLAAVENPDRYQRTVRSEESGRRDPHARHRTFDASLIAGGQPSWLIKPEDKRASVAYNIDGRSGVAQIYVNGVIGKALDSFDMECGGVCLDHVVAALEHLAEYSPTALALHFNSPGGTVTGVSEAADAITAFSRGVAPVHAYTDSMCASAAYWLACAADDFTAAASSYIGSIGVYCALVDSSKLYEDKGVFVKLISSGIYKGQGTPGVPLSEQYVALRRQQCQATAERFFGAVIGARGEEIASEAAAIAAANGMPLLPEEWAASIMQGQAWYASDAPRSLTDGFHADRRAHLRSLDVPRRR
jgi:ClpP class serine protease